MPYPNHAIVATIALAIAGLAASACVQSALDDEERDVSGQNCGPEASGPDCIAGLPDASTHDTSSVLDAAPDAPEPDRPPDGTDVGDEPDQTTHDTAIDDIDDDTTTPTPDTRDGTDVGAEHDTPSPDADDCTDGPRCAEPTCSDGVRNGDETDIDCGGPDCATCANGKTCVDDEDCASETCIDDFCRLPSCSDGVRNGDETDVDCGGSCAPCEVGERCEVADDCEPPRYDAWSTCGGFADVCANNGIESRDVWRTTCASGVCSASTTVETRTCSRNSNGTVCGEPSTGPWSACGGFTDTCDNTGTRSATTTSYRCAAGTCQSLEAVETQACSRDTTGVSCGETTTTTDECIAGGGDGCNSNGTQFVTTSTFACASGFCQSTVNTTSQACLIYTECMPCFGSSGAGICIGNSCRNDMLCP